MEIPKPFLFEELEEAIHQFTENIFNSSDNAFARRATEEGLTREQAAALMLGDAMQSYTQMRSATVGDSVNFILAPDWQYIRQRIGDLLSDIYMEHASAYEVKAAKDSMTLHRLAASTLLTDFKVYMESGRKIEIRIGIPEKHLHDDVGLED